MRRSQASSLWKLILARENEAHRQGAGIIACTNRDRLGRHFLALAVVFENRVAGANCRRAGIERLIERELKAGEL